MKSHLFVFTGIAYEFYMIVHTRNDYIWDYDTILNVIHMIWVTTYFMMSLEFVLDERLYTPNKCIVFNSHRMMISHSLRR